MAPDPVADGVGVDAVGAFGEVGYHLVTHPGRSMVECVLPRQHECTLGSWVSKKCCEVGRRGGHTFDLSTFDILSQYGSGLFLSTQEICWT